MFPLFLFYETTTGRTCWLSVRLLSCDVRSALTRADSASIEWWEMRGYRNREIVNCFSQGYIWIQNFYVMQSLAVDQSVYDEEIASFSFLVEENEAISSS